MKAAEIEEKYTELKYIASDGKTYKLSEKYPICLRIEDNEEEVYLDTGGEMANCMFFRAFIKDNYLYAITPENDNVPEKIAQIIV